METSENNTPFLEIENKIVRMLRTVYDPEIPVNIFDLGLIYNIDVKEDKTVDLEMTLTSPGCPMADFILKDVKMKIESIEEIIALNINLVFEPAWDRSMMTEEAQLELGFL